MIKAVPATWLGGFDEAAIVILITLSTGGVFHRNRRRQELGDEMRKTVRMRGRRNSDSLRQVLHVEEYTRPQDRRSEYVYMDADLDYCRI